MILLFFVIVWFVCLDVNEDFEELQIEIREHFDSEVDCLMSQFEINSNIMYNELLPALRNMFMNESSMLNDNESSFALCLKNIQSKEVHGSFQKWSTE